MQDESWTVCRSHHDAGCLATYVCRGFRFLAVNEACGRTRPTSYEPAAELI